MSILDIVENTSGTKFFISSDNFFPYFQRINKLNTEENRDLIFSELLKKKCIKEYYDLNYINDIFDYINLLWFERDFLENLILNKYMKNILKLYEKDITKYYKHKRFFYIKYNCNIFDIKMLMKSKICFIKEYNEPNICSYYNTFGNVPEFNNEYRYIYENKSDNFKYEFIKEDENEINEEGKNNFNDGDNYYCNDNKYNDYKNYNKNKYSIESNEYNKHYNFLGMEEYLSNKEYYSLYCSTCKNYSCDVSNDETDDNEIFYPALSELEYGMFQALLALF
ncbi:probable protein, unknown function [Plasmodium sp. DRC-Itaito]|nr:probable protein, unknown function [Plasmodium sp. DRC-Itaito]